MLCSEVLEADRFAAGANARRVLCGRLLVAALLALAGIPLIYLIAVRTRSGQAFENAALAGARRHRSGSWYDQADDWLNRITSGTFALSLAVIALVGVLRRRWLLALCGVATAGGAVLAARFLKSSLPRRPAFGGLPDSYQAANTLPSGHATAAMGLFFAMLIVVSRRWYIPATVLGLPGAVGSGVATIAAHWHRLSDTVAADLVALAAGLAGLAGVARLGLVRPSLRRSSGAQRILTAVVTVVATAGLAVGVAVYLRYQGATSVWARDAHAYWSAQALALGVGTAAAAVMLAVCCSLEAVPRRPRTLAKADP